jgi:predicted enzyme related to lactoylglutathione lyase
VSVRAAGVVLRQDVTVAESAIRLAAVVLTTSDLDRAVSLYRDGFGVEFHVGDHRGDDQWTSGRHAATSWTERALKHIALYATKDGSVTRGAQISFRVSDLEAAHSRAVAAGARVVHVPKTQPWGRSARYFDFDDNVIELTQPD